MSRYSEFFRFDTHAHFFTFVVYMAGLFDARADTVNFFALINEAETSKVITPDIIAKARDLLSQLDPVRTKVIVLRSNLFAHRSSSLSYAEGFHKAQVTPNQLRDFTTKALDLANCLLLGRGLEPIVGAARRLPYTLGLIDRQIRGVGVQSLRGELWDRRSTSTA